MQIKIFINITTKLKLKSFLSLKCYNIFEYFIYIYIHFLFYTSRAIFLNCVNLIDHYIKILIRIYKYIPSAFENFTKIFFN